MGTQARSAAVRRVLCRARRRPQRHRSRGKREPMGPGGCQLGVARRAASVRCTPPPRRALRAAPSAPPLRRLRAPPFLPNRPANHTQTHQSAHSARRQSPTRPTNALSPQRGVAGHRRPRTLLLLWHYLPLQRRVDTDGQGRRSLRTHRGCRPDGVGGQKLCRRHVR